MRPLRLHPIHPHTSIHTHALSCGNLSMSWCTVRHAQCHACKSHPRTSPPLSLCSSKQKHWILLKYCAALSGVTLYTEYPVTALSLHSRARAKVRARVRAKSDSARAGQGSVWSNPLQPVSISRCIYNLPVSLPQNRCARRQHIFCAYKPAHKPYLLSVLTSAPQPFIICAMQQQSSWLCQALFQHQLRCKRAD